jgi:hypothetical protein
MTRKIQKGVRITKGWPRKWKVVVLEVAKNEGKRILDTCQYQHIVEVIKRLKDFGNYEELSDLDIEPISDFWELREKGGPLRKINLRVYFAILKDDKILVILKAYKKEEDGQTPQHVIVSIQHRLNEYKRHRQ